MSVTDIVQEADNVGMSRGFRDADTSQRMSAEETDEAIRQVRAVGEEQARHAAELRNEGSFGSCEVCGRPIGDDRLQAVPDATRCVSCQAAWEAGAGGDDHRQHWSQSSV
jgi:RNA polymerase-binding transcription factor DksA